jgi:hypothetical protein
VEVPHDFDHLGGAALTVDRLRQYLHGPITPAERAAARRRVDELAEHRWPVR